ncbi:hypothetical protein EVAR_52929_1 [Eumeta japonica]|uniref:Uncharacterized protein n=1 Tax=Eumeta variegata TaxID=151549 RepID=A0A4C1Y7K7_EUMVA|nr:hypothetical protein EVAR_52929_1 [Eumeta japonica]
MEEFSGAINVVGVHTSTPYYRALFRFVDHIRNDIVSTDDIDNAIGALANHIRTVVESSSRTVPAKSDRRELPGDVIELIRDKNAAFRGAGKYPSCENRFRARALQRKVKARMKEVRN